MLVKVILSFMVMLVSTVLPYTYTSWTTMTGKRTIAVAPTIWGGQLSDPGSSTLDLNTAFGIGDNADLILNISKISQLGDFSWAGIEAMPRYAINENIVFALKLGTDFEALFLSPQLHLNKEGEKLILELNAAIDLSGNTDFKEGTIWASHGLVYKLLPEVLYPFVEFNPYISYGYFATEFSFSIDPGIWFGVKDTPHNFAISFPISGIKEKDISVGLNGWYWWSFEY